MEVLDETLLNKEPYFETLSLFNILWTPDVASVVQNILTILKHKLFHFVKTPSDTMNIGYLKQPDKLSNKRMRILLLNKTKDNLN